MSSECPVSLGASLAISSRFAAEDLGLAAEAFSLAVECLSLNCEVRQLSDEHVAYDGRGFLLGGRVSGLGR